MDTWHGHFSITYFVLSALLCYLGSESVPNLLAVFDAFSAIGAVRVSGALRGSWSAWGDSFKKRQRISTYLCQGDG
jgi:hypothetical protein